MPSDVPRSWQEQFDASLRRLVDTPAGSRALVAPSIDAYITEFPLEPDDRWGSEMDALHRTALRAYVLRQLAFVSNDLERAAERCESPPERAMLYALAIMAWDYVDGVLLRIDHSAAGQFASQFTYVEIEPQAAIGGYRVDFLLTMRLKAPATTAEASLVVECDGHDFHERTRDQARRDRARDRALQGQDFPVFRYTGSDVWRDVFAAATEACGELSRRFEAARREASAT